MAKRCSLLIPAIINFALPAAIMSFWIPTEKPAAVMEAQSMKRGGLVIIGLFVLTIITSASFENFLSLPPAAGMMLGLTYLSFFSYYLQQTVGVQIYAVNDNPLTATEAKQENSFDVFQKVANLEWDTLLFFYGVWCD
jgi:Na+/H+ antiporter NhaD/arsenite permease-like protein